MNDETFSKIVRDLEARGIDRRSLMRFVIGAGAAAPAAALLGRSAFGLNEAAAQDAKPGGTLVYARDGDADSLDPHKTTTTLSWQVQAQLYDSLVAFDADGGIKPNLAKSWDVSPDGTQYTFHLQEGMTFHDGTPLDANAVKFTFDRFISPDTQNPSKASIGPLKSTDAVDNLTVRMTFDKPFAPLLSFLTDPFSGIVSPAGAQKFGKDFGNNPVGSGPFQFKEWVKGDHITLERFNAYKAFHPMYKHQGPAYLDSVNYRTIPEQQARSAALDTGEVNIAEPPLEEVDQIKSSQKYQLFVAQNTGQLIFLEFAVHKAPFNDERIRQAVGYGVDQDAIINIALNGLVQATACTVGPGILGGNSGVCKTDGFTHDPDKAKALLKEAGYGDKKVAVTLATWPGGNREQVAQLVQNQLNGVGFDVKLETMDIGTLNARVKQENDTPSGGGFFDMMGWAWFDPDILYALFHSPGWVDGFSDPALDKQLEQQRATPDQTQRVALLDQIQKYLLDHAAMVPLYSPGWNWILAAQNNVHGFQFAPFNRALLFDVNIAF